MSKIEKLLKRFLSYPADFNYNELKRVMHAFGYKESLSGKTSGSQVAFINSATQHIIRLHKPHPTPVLKKYQIKHVENELRRKGVIQ